MKKPFVTKEQANALNKRLDTEFNHEEQIQVHGQIDFEDSNHDKYTIKGIADVIKNNIVYELKFVSELKHEHYLQCACYMIMLGLDQGILWNTRNNEMYTITIPDKNRFLASVINTVTKNEITTPQYDIIV